MRRAERARALAPLFEQYAIEAREQHLRLQRAWRAVHTHVQLIPHVMYPYDPAVLRAIREWIDPNAVAVWVTKVYQAQTGGLRLAGFHALASNVWNPRGEAPAPWTRRVLMPSTGALLYPNHMNFHVMDGRTRKGDGLPGEYLPFDYRVFKIARDLYDKWSLRENLLWLRDNGAAAKATRAREAAERRVNERWNSTDGRRVRVAMRDFTKADVDQRIRELVDPPRKTYVDVRRKSGGVLVRS